MRKSILFFALASISITTLIACKDKKKDQEATTTSQPTVNPEVPKPTEEKPSASVNQPKTYALSFTPDSIILGKDKQAFIKVLSGEAIELQDVEGKSTGMNIKFKFRATNKSTIETPKSFYVSPSECRLELDNGTSTTYKNGSSLNAEPEASKDGEWEWEIPAGTKPVKLNMFFDGTRVSVAIAMK
jgi:hypothetical protein